VSWPLNLPRFEEVYVDDSLVIDERKHLKAHKQKQKYQTQWQSKYR
jgi:hypothetical protein